MTVCAKVLLVVSHDGVENRRSSTSFLVLLKNNNAHDEPLQMTSQALDGICGNFDKDVLHPLTLMVGDALENRHFERCTEEVILADYALRINKAKYVPYAQSDRKLMYGSAVCLVAKERVQVATDTPSPHLELYTGLSVVHATMKQNKQIINMVVLFRNVGSGKAKQMRKKTLGSHKDECVGETETIATHTENVLHFVTSDKIRCINMKNLNLGTRATRCALRQPMISYYQRRLYQIQVHKTSFLNLGFVNLLLK